MRSLNPDHLRALTEVVAQGSFTQAAKRLNLAQPTISLQIRELETRLGVQLVDRLGKRAFATAAGRDLIEHAQRIHERPIVCSPLCGAIATAGSGRCASAPARRRLSITCRPCCSACAVSTPTSNWS